MPSSKARFLKKCSKNFAPGFQKPLLNEITTWKNKTPNQVPTNENFEFINTSVQAGMCLLIHDNSFDVNQKNK